MSRSFVVILLAACAAPPEAAAPARRTFDATPERIRAACRDALRGWPIQTEGDVIETGWRETDGPTSTAGRLLGTRDLERSRFHVTIEGNEVAARVDVERRPRLGATATRWERAYSDGRHEREFFDRVEASLR